MALCELPARPKHESLYNAYSVLTRSVDSAESFFEAFSKVRSARNAKGTPTDHEQDLLRAALLFSAAGLDAMVKQLVRDALEHILELDKGAQGQFADFIQTRIGKIATIDTKYLTQALLADHPRNHFRIDLVRDLTSNSLQSKDQLLRVGAYFAIRADEITQDLDKLKQVFDARNHIAHEMDVLFGQTNRSRRSRAYEVMRDYTSFILNVSCAFYKAVEGKLVARAG